MQLFRRPRKPVAAAPVKAEAEDKACRFVSASRSHVGTVRLLNEDRLLDLTGEGFWAVADGMGGHRAGDLAAEMVIENLTAIAGSANLDSIRAAVEDANMRLLAQTASGEKELSGSTIIALKAADGRYDCLWAGDSQAWLLRDGSWRQISRDHSLVEDLVDAGAISAEQRDSHPQRNVITRAVGVAEPLALDHVCGDLREGDLLLLCSDGLTNAVRLDRIGTPEDPADLEGFADDLLSEALAAGASDNVSLVLIGWLPAS